MRSARSSGCAAPLPAARGCILDHSGEPLALSLQAQDIYADRDYITDPAGTAEALAPLLGDRPQRIERVLRADGPFFVYIAQQVDTAWRPRPSDSSFPASASFR